MSAIAPLPVVAQITLSVDEAERKQLAHLAAKLRAEEPQLGWIEPFGENVRLGCGEGPSLVLGDPCGLALFELPGDWALEYRALLLAGDGDCIALGISRNPAFEQYCRDVLDLGHPGVLAPASTASRVPLATRCMRDPRVLGALVDIASRAGRLNIVPYIGAGAVWNLAGTIAAESGTLVCVGAPPPRLTRRVNDKLWFARRVQEALGAAALPPTFSAFGPAALAARVRTLPRRHEWVAVKLPDSAGSAGNLVMEAEAVRRLSALELQARLVRRLGELSWRGRYPLLVSVWECPVIVSPSLQLWIPPRDGGDPVVEGIFDQSLRGLEGEFVGCVPSSLPERWHVELAGEGVLLGYLLQELGYFGRCSLDAILVGNELASAKLHWVECNARWGGTSIPMTLVNRLVGSWKRRPFAVVQRTGLHAPPRPFAWFLGRFRERLFRPGESASGIIPLAPEGIEEGTGFHFIALAPNLRAALEEARNASAILIDPSERP